MKNFKIAFYWFGHSRQARQKYDPARRPGRAARNLQSHLHADAGRTTDGDEEETHRVQALEGEVEEVSIPYAAVLRDLPRG
jgi:hypothetical protein